MTHRHGSDLIHFPAVRNGVLDPWRWEAIESHRVDAEFPKHVLILTEREPQTVRIAPHSPPGVRRHGGNETAAVTLVNRGAPITLEHLPIGSGSGLRTSEVGTGSVLIMSMLVRYESDGTVESEYLSFRAPRDDESWRDDLWLRVDSPTDMAAGKLSISCDWSGTRTLDLYLGGVLKRKWMFVTAGHHALRVVKPSVFAGLEEGREIPAELRVSDRILWTGVVRVPHLLQPPRLTVRHFDLLPYLPVSAQGSREVHQGALSIEAAWEGEQQLELWRKGGTTKIAKWPDLGPGEHVLLWRLLGSALTELRAGSDESYQTAVELRLQDVTEPLWSAPILVDVPPPLRP